MWVYFWVFHLAHVHFDNLEGEGFTIYAAAYHQEVIEMVLPSLSG